MGGQRRPGSIGRAEAAGPREMPSPAAGRSPATPAGSGVTHPLSKPPAASKPQDAPADVPKTSGKER